MFRKLSVIPLCLGRWARTSNELNNIKVDLANIDHCGVCVHEKTGKEPEKPKMLIKVDKTNSS